jgi:hypothetical protein
MSAQHKLAARLVALDTMSSAELRQAWLGLRLGPGLTPSPLPRISPAMLRLALAWELQAAVHGGLSRKTQQRLDQLAGGRSTTREVRPGTRLLREWNGTLHVVTIDDDGAIGWNGRQWASLSAVAREITGTRWSGPAFFGLRQKRTAA